MEKDKFVLVYKSKIVKIAGTDFHEVYGEAFDFYKLEKRKTKRRPYLRSAYFDKEKVFLDLFWIHIGEKQNFRDKIRRMKFFPCAIDLIKNSKFPPTSKENPNKRSEILHRFKGKSRDSDLFFVQIKENKKSGQKWLISVFPCKK